MAKRSLFICSSSGNCREREKQESEMCPFQCVKRKIFHLAFKEDFCFKVFEMSNTTLKMVSLRGKI